MEDEIFRLRDLNKALQKQQNDLNGQLKSLAEENITLKKHQSVLYEEGKKLLHHNENLVSHVQRQDREMKQLKDSIKGLASEESGSMTSASKLCSVLEQNVQFKSTIIELNEALESLETRARDKWQTELNIVTKKREDEKHAYAERIRALQMELETVRYGSDTQKVLLQEREKMATNLKERYDATYAQVQVLLDENSALKAAMSSSMVEHQRLTDMYKTSSQLQIESSVKLKSVELERTALDDMYQREICERQRLQADRDVAIAENVELRQKISDGLVEIASLRGHNEKLELEFSLHKQINSKFQQEKSEVEERWKRMSELADDHDKGFRKMYLDIKAEKDKLLLEYETLKMTSTSLQSKAEDSTRLSCELKVIQNEHVTTVTKLNDQLRSLTVDKNKQIENLRSELNTLKEDNVSLQQLVTNNGSDLQEHVVSMDRFNNLKEQFDRVKACLNTKEEEITRIVESQTSWMEIASGLKKEIGETLNPSISSLKQSLEDASQRENSMNAKLAEGATQLDQAKAEINKITEELNSLRDEHKLCVDKIGQANEEARKVQNSLKEVEQHVVLERQTLNSRVQEMESEYQSVVRRHAADLNSLAEAKKKVTEFENQLAKERSRVVDLQNEIERMKLMNHNDIEIVREKNRMLEEEVLRAQDESRDLRLALSGTTSLGNLQKMFETADSVDKASSNDVPIQTTPIEELLKSTMVQRDNLWKEALRNVEEKKKQSAAIVTLERLLEQVQETLAEKERLLANAEVGINSGHKEENKPLSMMEDEIHRLYSRNQSLHHELEDIRSSRYRLETEIRQAKMESVNVMKELAELRTKNMHLEENVITQTQLAKLYEERLQTLLKQSATMKMSPKRKPPGEGVGAEKRPKTVEDSRTDMMKGADELRRGNAMAKASDNNGIRLNGPIVVKLPSMNTSNAIRPVVPARVKSTAKNVPRGKSADTSSKEVVTDSPTDRSVPLNSANTHENTTVSQLSSPILALNESMALEGQGVKKDIPPSEPRQPIRMKSNLISNRPPPLAKTIDKIQSVPVVKKSPKPGDDRAIQNAQLTNPTNVMSTRSSVTTQAVGKIVANNVKGMAARSHLMKPRVGAVKSGPTSTGTDYRQDNSSVPTKSTVDPPTIPSHKGGIPSNNGVDTSGTTPRSTEHAAKTGVAARSGLAKPGPVRVNTGRPLMPTSLSGSVMLKTQATPAVQNIGGSAEGSLVPRAEGSPKAGGSLGSPVLSKAGVSPVVSKAGGSLVSPVVSKAGGSVVSPVVSKAGGSVGVVSKAGVSVGSPVIPKTGGSVGSPVVPKAGGSPSVPKSGESVSGPLVPKTGTSAKDPVVSKSRGSVGSPVKGTVVHKTGGSGGRTIVPKTEGLVAPKTGGYPVERSMVMSKSVSDGSDSKAQHAMHKTQAACTKGNPRYHEITKAKTASAPKARESIPGNEVSDTLTQVTSVPTKKVIQPAQNADKNDEVQVVSKIVKQPIRMKSNLISNRPPPLAKTKDKIQSTPAVKKAVMVASKSGDMKAMQHEPDRHRISLTKSSMGVSNSSLDKRSTSPVSGANVKAKAKSVDRVSSINVEMLKRKMMRVKPKAKAGNPASRTNPSSNVHKGHITKG